MIMFLGNGLLAVKHQTFLKVFMVGFSTDNVVERFLVFKVVTLGVSISEVFYPLYYELVKKSPAKERVEKVKKVPKQAKNSHLPSLVEVSKPVLSATEKKASKIANDLLIFSGEKDDFAISMAIKLVKRFAIWKGKLAKKGILLPLFYFSCDNGYSHELLAKICENNDLYYISVVKKTHNFKVNGIQIKAVDLMKKRLFAFVSKPSIVLKITKK